jgi:2-polyprenyl-3-methyl-5-hydroxy-6-metoxy-1,4-benzoquinol methylase
MPSTPEASSLPFDAPRVNDYNSFAEAYAAENETSLNNAFYERPATLALAGDVTGRRILDAGCGSGILFEALRDRGATVSGIDLSAGLLDQARRPTHCLRQPSDSRLLHRAPRWTPARLLRHLRVDR